MYKEYLKLEFLHGAHRVYLRSFHTFVDYMLLEENKSKLQTLTAAVTEGDIDSDIEVLRGAAESVVKLNVYKSALIKSCLFDVCESADGTLPSFATMKTSLGRNVFKQTFISADLEINITNNSKKHVTEDRQCFGRLKHMFRFSFTSGIENIPCAAADWAEFKCADDGTHRVCSIGELSEQEWTRGPSQHVLYKQYIPLGLVKPSRFCLSYNPILYHSVQCAFISLDPERLGENLNDEYDQDFGDNQFPHFKPSKSVERAYLNNLVNENGGSNNSDDDNNDDDDDISIEYVLSHIPSSVKEFISSYSL